SADKKEPRCGKSEGRPLLRSTVGGNSRFLLSPFALRLHFLDALRDQRRVKRLDPTRISPLRLPAQGVAEIKQGLVMLLRLPARDGSCHGPLGLDMRFVDRAL